MNQSTVGTTLTGCHCCKRGYPPAEMFHFPWFVLCGECIETFVMTAIEDCSTEEMNGFLARVRKRHQEHD